MASHRSRYRQGLARSRAAWAVAVTAALAGALLLGRWTAPGDAGPVSAGSTGASPPFVQSPDGAKAAAAWYLTRIYGSRGLSDGEIRQRFTDLVTRPEALDRLIRLTATDFDGHPVPPGSVTRAAVVGARQESYTPTAARIAVWTALVYADRGGAQDSPWQRWLVGMVSLEWQAGWRFAAVDALEGPMPPPHSGQAANAVGTDTELVGVPDRTFEPVPDGR